MLLSLGLGSFVGWKSRQVSQKHTRKTRLTSGDRHVARWVESLEGRALLTPLFAGVPVNDLPFASIGEANTSRNVAVSTDGEIHVAYSGAFGVRLATSLNSGASFQPSVLISAGGADHVEVATNGANELFVGWTTLGTYFVSRSIDSGTSFSAPQFVGLSDGDGISLAVFGSNVYVQGRTGSEVFRNATNGLGAYASTPVFSHVFADLEVDPSTGDLYQIGDTPTVRIFESADSGASFAFLPLSGTVNDIFYSTSASSFSPAGNFGLVSGVATDANRINLTTGVSTGLTFGNNTTLQGRSLVADAFGNLVDLYDDFGAVTYAVSQDLGDTFAAPVLVAGASTANVTINPLFQDIVVVYQVGTDLSSAPLRMNCYSAQLPPTSMSMTTGPGCCRESIPTGSGRRPVLVTTLSRPCKVE